jgi:hypothetical protein
MRTSRQPTAIRTAISSPFTLRLGPHCACSAQCAW